MSIKNDFFVILEAQSVEPVLPPAPMPASTTETNSTDEDDDESP
jgi:hypothetical protein